jgi:hypothetical protein
MEKEGWIRKSRRGHDGTAPSRNSIFNFRFRFLAGQVDKDAKVFKMTDKNARPTIFSKYRNERANVENNLKFPSTFFSHGYILCPCESLRRNS